ncbi:MAG: peptide chain release factor 2 [Chloroflexota bacterium]|nr:MAG: peptide chain release factor 2 [Chloroflexota bacterium]
MQETIARLQTLRERIQTYAVRLDLAGKEQEASQLEQESTRPEFWLEPESAQSTMRRLTRLKEQIGTWSDLAQEVSELLELAELVGAEADETLSREVESRTEEVAQRVDGLEFELILSGDYDAKNAILSVHAGAGGTESQDWAEMLLRMYLRWAEAHRYKVSVLDSSPGEEAGIKSATLEITGSHAYGYLKAEKGVHRLVRLSPFDAAHRRHTSFALVEVMPEPDEDVEIVINPDDLRIDTFRASSAGGQNVQKTSTAVRITHLSTGIVVSCQNERSQIQNKDTAMKILRARLMELELQRKEEEQSKIKGEHIAAGWGNQIRSYVLHPYNMVKDHRTGQETSNTSAVLDGDIDAFIQSYLKSTVSGQ